MREGANMLDRIAAFFTRLGERWDASFDEDRGDGPPERCAVCERVRLDCFNGLCGPCLSRAW